MPWFDDDTLTVVRGGAYAGNREPRATVRH